MAAVRGDWAACGAGTPEGFDGERAAASRRLFDLLFPGARTSLACLRVTRRQYYRGGIPAKFKQ